MKPLIFLFILFSPISIAGQCQQITFSGDAQDYHVDASINTGLHIRFFDDVEFAILANDKVWKGKSNPNLKSHYWLFPKNRVEQDNVVGNTFVLKSGHTINLVVSQKLNASSCLVVDSALDDAQIVADYTSNTVHASSAVSLPAVSSSYSFDSPYVYSAFDDGRFTQVVLKNYYSSNDSFSVVSIVNGEQHMVSNPTYDQVSNKWTVPGIHDHLLFTNSKTSFSVIRK